MARSQTGGRRSPSSRRCDPHLVLPFRSADRSNGSPVGSGRLGPLGHPRVWCKVLKVVPMATVIVGYGEFANHALTEVSDQFLSVLAERYPLDCRRYDASEGESLLITVAIHQEVQRRAVGGHQVKRVPTIRDLASAIVSSGFQQMSKVHHPDRSGQPEAQLRLTAARDQLRRACEEIVDEGQSEAIVIGPPQPPRAAPPYSSPISEDAVPF